MKNYLMILVSIFLALGSNFPSIGQYSNAPKVEWSKGIDIPKRLHDHEEDWALSIIETSKGDFMSAGFSQGTVSCSAAIDRRLPAWVMVDSQGALVGEGIIDFGKNFRDGLFNEVVEGADGFYFVGNKQDNGDTDPAYIALAKIDKESFEVTYQRFIEVFGFGFTEGSASDVQIIYNANNEEVGLVITGTLGTDQEKGGFILKTDMNGDPLSGVGEPYESWFFTGTDGLRNSISSCEIIYDGTGNPQDIVFVGYQAMKDHSFISDPDDLSKQYYNSEGIMDMGPGSLGANHDGSIGRTDNDIVVGKINFNDFTNGPEFFKTFNSTPLKFEPPQSDALFNLYPRVYTSELGPATPGRTIDNNQPGCSLPSDSHCCYSKVLDDQFEFNSDDRAKKMFISQDGNIVLSAWLNTFIIAGDPSLWRLQNNQVPLVGGGVDHSHDPVLNGNCNGYEYTHYYDAEAYLLKIDISNGNLLNAAHVGHLSGGDFNTPIVEESDGSIVVGGTTADKGFTDLPDVTAPFANFLIKTDADFNPVWRTHFVGEGKGNCLFGMTKTSDGGYVVCGNGDEVIYDEFDEVPGDEIIIENYSIIKLAPSKIQESVTFDGDIIMPIHTINSTNNLWTSDRKINSLVVVPEGQTLTIDGTNTSGGIEIEFAYSKYTKDYDDPNPVGIKVEKGAGLIIKDAVLKGLTIDDKEYMWDGIMVLGDPKADLAIVDQGTITVNSGSRIENAVIGVLLDEYSFPQEVTESTSVFNDCTPGLENEIGEVLSKKIRRNSNSKGGGRIFATGTQFLNNYESVVFHRADGNNLSELIQCSFLCNDFMADEFTYRAENGNRLGSRVFVLMDQVHNVNFENCSFRGNTNLDMDQWGRGIESFNSRYSVIGSTAFEFRDLRVGIEAMGLNFGFNNSVDIQNNTFFNVHQSINLRSTFGAQVLNNEFLNIPQDNADWNGSGVFCNFSGGFLIADNTFENLSPNDAYGLVVNNSIGNGGIVADNKFTGLVVGNQFEDNNLELEASCNDYNLIQNRAWSVVESVQGLGALKNQGEGADDFEDKANNEFLDNCNGNFPNQFSNHIYSDFYFNYYTKVGNPNRPMENCVSAGFGFSTNQSDFSTEPCVLDFAPPCPNPPCHDEEKLIYDNSPKGIADRNRLLRSYLHWNTYENPGPDNLIEIEAVKDNLELRTDQTDYRLLVNGLIVEQQYSQASIQMNALTGTDDETLDFMAYNNILIQAGLSGEDWSNLSENNKQVLLDYKTATTAVKDHANTVDYYYNKIYTPLLPVPVSTTPIPGFRLEKPETIAGNVKVYPNPFEEYIQFEALNGNIYSIEILNLLGQRVWYTDFNKEDVSLEEPQNTNAVIWRPNRLESGTYFYKIKTQDGQNQSGKVLYLK